MSATEIATDRPALDLMPARTAEKRRLEAALPDLEDALAARSGRVRDHEGRIAAIGVETDQLVALGDEKGLERLVAERAALALKLEVARKLQAAAQAPVSATRERLREISSAEGLERVRHSFAEKEDARKAALATFEVKYGELAVAARGVREAAQDLRAAAQNLKLHGLDAPFVGHQPDELIGQVIERLFRARGSGGDRANLVLYF